MLNEIDPRVEAACGRFMWESNKCREGELDFWPDHYRSDLVGNLRAYMKAAIVAADAAASSLWKTERDIHIETVAVLNARVAELEKKVSRLDALIWEVAKWAWRPSDVLTDSERLSVIKYHPVIKIMWETQKLIIQETANPLDDAVCPPPDEDKALAKQEGRSC